MNAHVAVARCCRGLVAGGLAFSLPLAAFALDNAPAEGLSVKVYPDRYVAAGRPFPDLAALEAWAKPTRIRVLWLDGCGSDSAKPLLAAVERFHSVHADAIQIRTFGPEEQGCAPVDEQGYYATDESGRSIIP